MSPENGSHPVVDTSGKQIVEIGIVVRDAVKTARRYADIFGLGPWVFSDRILTDAVYHGIPIGKGTCCLRCAAAMLGKRTIELMQPLYGQSSHRDYLESCGEGIHHVGFGNIPDYDQWIGGLDRHGIGLEMTGSIQGAAPFSYLATQDVLGTRFQIKAPVLEGHTRAYTAWGHYPASSAGIIRLGDKEINQLGIVVEDVEKTTAAYWRLFGIGPWVFMEGRMGDQGALLHGVPYADPEAVVKIATAELDDMQFELLEPVKGISSHMDYLKTSGQGIHHVSFGDVEDHDDIVDAMQQEGIGIEMSGVLGNAITFTYFASQKDLGTIYEVLKINPHVECTLAPTGIYPPQ